jgi:serine/threonine protein phosphatase 1
VSNSRLFIVGDIHACPTELETLIHSLPLDKEDRLVFLGDYVDRGPGACEVIDFLLEFESSREGQVFFLKGNHEDMLLDYLGYAGHYGDAFLFNGGHTTLKSYGLSPIMTRKEMAALLPEAHLRFLLNLRTRYLAEDILCVHAGISPLRPLEEQNEEELLWIRQEFIFNPHPLPYTIIFGHTPQREVFFDLPYKVGIDTGLVYGGKLSCLEVVENKLFQIKKGSKKVEVKDVELIKGTAKTISQE